MSTKSAQYHSKNNQFRVVYGPKNLWTAQRLSNRAPSKTVDKWDNICRPTTYETAKARMDNAAAESKS
jgi:hypothetical protein